MGKVALPPKEFLHNEVGLEQMTYAILCRRGGFFTSCKAGGQRNIAYAEDDNAECRIIHPPAAHDILIVLSNHVDSQNLEQMLSYSLLFSAQANPSLELCMIPFISVQEGAEVIFFGGLSGFNGIFYIGIGA